MRMARSYLLNWLCVSVFIVLFNPFVAVAADIDDAVHAMREGNFAEAYCIMRPLADAGDADSQYNIGWMYLNGYGLAINDSLALEWWLRASEQGHVDATFSIAMLYSLGDGQVEKDTGIAIDYYLMAAEAEHEDARMIIKSMLKRNDVSILERSIHIVNTYAHWLGEYYRVNTNRLNVRSQPSIESKVVETLMRGDIVLELGRQNNWSQVAVKGLKKIYWVYAPLLEIVEVEKVLSVVELEKD